MPSVAGSTISQCSDMDIPNSLTVGLTFSDMVRVVACHARDRGSNPVGSYVFFPLGLLHWWQRLFGNA